nr:hypothetical protein [Eubacterium sp.]
MTIGIISGAGGTSGQRISTSDRRQTISATYGKENVTIKVGEEKNLLDEYREMGVDLQLTGAQSEETLTEEEKEEQRKMEQEKNLMRMYQEQMEAAKDNADAMGEAMKDVGRALEIARRMMKGDIVPPSDEKFLMDYNKDIYMGAKNMQAMAQNEDPEKHDSVLEEEESEGNASVKVEGNDISIDASSVNLVRTELPKQ